MSMVPPRKSAVARVTVEREHEAPTGWVFDVAVHRASTPAPAANTPPASAPAPASTPAPDEPAIHSVALAWVDYEHWSHGTVAPERIAKAVVETLLAANTPDPLPQRFDASTARRWLPTFDDRLREALNTTFH